MSELAQAINDIAFHYVKDIDGFCDFDCFSEEHKAELVRLYMAERLESHAYEVLENIDPRDFNPLLEYKRSGIDHAEIGRLIVKEITDYCRNNIQEIINEELRSDAA